MSELSYERSPSAAFNDQRMRLRLIIEGQQRLNFQPIDDLEDHSALEDLGFEVGGMHLPFGSLPNAKPAFLALLGKRIVSRERSTDAMVHHGEAVVRECLIIHQVCRLCATSL